ncbi:MAG: ATP synthase F0 subunit B [Butyrivibrio sp.]|nr:ATP synthase F0 subunit B [Acetatifactor muris]MCM1560416.1 ATP synthase F0 subunit B [Butyrivibrio sp.]
MNIPLNIDWQQILLHLFNFVILAGGLYFLLYKPVKSFMEKRTAYYQGMDKAAADKMEQAEAREQEYRRRLEGADLEIRRKKEQAAKEAEKAAEAILSEANKQREQIIAEAQREARHEKEKMVQDAKEEIVGLALAATEKMLHGEAISHE